MEVRIYDRDLNFKGVIENHTSLIWTRKYYEPGNFEIHAPITEQNLRLLAKGNIISKRGSSEAGVIEDIENEESDLKNEITAKGRFLSSYMDRRLIKSTVNFSGKIEVAMRNLLSGVTAIPLVELGTLNGFTETVEFQATMKQNWQRPERSVIVSGQTSGTGKLYLKPTKEPTGPRRRVSIPALSFRRVTTT